MKTRWWRQFGELVRKDLSVQWQSRETIFVVVLFALLILLVFAFAYGPFFVPLQLDASARRRELAKLASAVFWVSAAFAGVIALHRGAEVDRAEGAWRAIRLAGVNSTVVYFAKVISMAVLLAGVQVVLLPATIVFLQVDAFGIRDVTRLAGITALGILGFSGLGAFFAAMAVGARGRESLLTVVLLPLLIPLLIAATKCSVPVFASEPIRDMVWLGFLGAYPPIVLAMGTLLFESVMEE